MKKLFWLIAAGSAVALTGCGRPHPAPPTERNELVVRFFDSIHSGDAFAATAQAHKIKAADPHNESISTLIEIHESNSSIIRAQRELNRQNLARAMAVLAEGCRRYPENRTLQLLNGQLRQLRSMERLIGSIERARNSTQLSAALMAARTGLSSNITPELEKYFDACDKRAAALASRELEARKRAAAAEKRP